MGLEGHIDLGLPRCVLCYFLLRFYNNVLKQIYKDLETVEIPQRFNDKFTLKLFIKSLVIDNCAVLLRFTDAFCFNLEVWIYMIFW